MGEFLAPKGQAMRLLVSVLASLVLMICIGCGGNSQESGSFFNLSSASDDSNSNNNNDDDDDGGSGSGGSNNLTFEPINKRFAGPTVGESFGMQAIVVDDINGDGVDDIAALSEQGLHMFDPTADPTDTSAATLWYVDKDVPSLQGYLLLCHEDNATGAAMANVGDVNNDGIDDIGIGIRSSNQGVFQGGTVCVVSGSNGASLLLIGGENNQDGFGTSLAPLGDLNADGHDDFAVGALWEDENGTSAGAVYIISSKDGSHINKIIGEVAIDYFGTSIANGEDINGGGTADLIVGAIGFDGSAGSGSGAVYVLAGEDIRQPRAQSIVANADSATLLRIDGGQQADEGLGGSVDGGHDLDGDGVLDIVAGAPGNALVEGAAYGFSGQNGSRLFRWQQSTDSDQTCTTNFTNYGGKVAFVGDANGDGISDIGVGDHSYSAPGSCYTGKVYVNRFTGIDQAPDLLYSILGDDQYDNVGHVIGKAGDVNGDGFSDTLLGKYSIGVNGTGEVQIINQ